MEGFKAEELVRRVVFSTTNQISSSLSPQLLLFHAEHISPKGIDLAELGRVAPQKVPCMTISLILVARNKREKYLEWQMNQDYSLYCSTVIAPLHCNWRIDRLIAPTSRNWKYLWGWRCRSLSAQLEVPTCQMYSPCTYLWIVSIFKGGETRKLSWTGRRGKRSGGMGGDYRFQMRDCTFWLETIHVFDVRYRLQPGFRQ